MKIEIRSANEAHISGYVNAVERDSRVLPKQMCPKATTDFVEKVSAGAFGRAVSRNPNVRILLNHGKEIGSVGGGTLKLCEDAIGLHAEAVITDPETVSAAREGRLLGWSFGFENARDSWEPYRDGVQRRTLLDFELPEVSILTKTPAYIGTSVETRAAEDGVSVTERRGFDDNAEVCFADGCSSFPDGGSGISLRESGRTNAEVCDMSADTISADENMSNTAAFYEKQLEILKYKGEM